jgi:PKHD-type hydroxylase
MYLTDNNCLSISLFNEDYCNNIIENSEKLRIKEAAIQDGDNKNRSSKVAWIKENDELYEDIKEVIFNHNVKADWNFKLKEFEPLQYTIYEEGDHYDWHIDSHTKPYDNGYIRKLSFTLCLNEDYEGGELEIANLNPKRINQNIKFKDKFTTGTIVTFPSFMWHKVHPVTKGTRKVLVGWVVGPPFV